MNRPFDVFKRSNNVPVKVGVVMANEQNIADRKARSMFGFGAWAVDRERVAA